jgi:hypothetical protein
MIITTDTIARAILTAPAWAKVGITAEWSELRDEAAQEVAACVYDSLYQSADIQTDQLALPLDGL